MYKIFIKKNAMYVGMLELTTFANDKTDLPHFMHIRGLNLNFSYFRGQFVINIDFQN